MKNQSSILVLINLRGEKNKHPNLWFSSEHASSRVMSYLGWSPEVSSGTLIDIYLLPQTSPSHFSFQHFLCCLNTKLMLVVQGQNTQHFDEPLCKGLNTIDWNVNCMQTSKNLGEAWSLMNLITLTSSWDRVHFLTLHWGRVEFFVCACTNHEFIAFI